MKRRTLEKIRNKISPERVAILMIGIVLGLLMSAVFVDDENNSAGSNDKHSAPEKNAHTWTCSMHPQVKQPEAGLCPLCGMDLIPLTEGGGELGPKTVVLSERAKTLARIRTTQVMRLGSNSSELRLLGRIEPSEASQKDVTAWTGGRIDRLHVKVTGQAVRKGQVIATLYSPEIFAAHQDLIVAKRQLARLKDGSETTKAAAGRAHEASKNRLRLLGVPDEEITNMERADSPAKQIAIRTPFGGTVMERIATEGAYVQTGALLYKVADLSTLWVQLDAYESDLPLISLGQEAAIQVEGFSDHQFAGKITFIDPVVDPIRRTSQVRVAVKNKDRFLAPGMFVEAEVKTKNTKKARSPLVIPSTAPLFTGRRSIVFVEIPATETPTYTARTVRLGPRTGEVYPVVAGLTEGERVVTRGAFTLDADLQIRGGQSMMTALDDSAREGEDPVIRISAGDREKLVPVLDAYLKVQKQLAADDFNKANTASKKLARLAIKISLGGPKKAIEFWSALREALSEQAEQLAKASSIEESRGVFERMSHQMIQLLERLGNPLKEPVRLAYCPMAMGSKGAHWIQRGEIVDNSYFGDLMRTCGEIQETVEGGAYLLLEQPVKQSGAEAEAQAPARGHSR